MKTMAAGKFKTQCYRRDRLSISTGVSTQSSQPSHWCEANAEGIPLLTRDEKLRASPMLQNHLVAIYRPDAGVLQQPHGHH
jgi:hypothetical protein